MTIDMNAPLHAQMFGKVTHPQDYWHNGRILSCFLLICPISGTLTFSVSGTQHSLFPGTLLIIPPETEYHPVSTENGAYYFYHFNATLTETAENRLSISARSSVAPDEYSYSYTTGAQCTLDLESFISLSDPESVNLCLERAASLDLWQNPTEKLLLDTFLRELLIRISNQYRSHLPADRKFRKILTYIRMHSAEPISLPTVAAHFSLSESYTARLFRQNLGMRCCDYINQIRLSAACELLSNTELSVGEIAERVGYQSIYYFSRLFSRRYHLSPRAFRNSHPSHF